MRKMPNSHLLLLLDIREEGTFVVDFEGEDAMLVREGEGCSEAS
jgi:hypothetical protein